MIEKINHYSFTTPASVHDEEALTALELVGRIGKKVNELIDDQNEVHKLAMETMPELVKDTVNNHIENGAFDAQINEYAGDMEDELSHKMDKREHANVHMANLGEDVKLAMTGGSVPVVGNNAVYTDALQPKCVTPNKTDFIAGFRQYRGYIDTIEGEYYNSASTTLVDTFSTRLEPFKVHAGESLYFKNVRLRFCWIKWADGTETNFATEGDPTGHYVVHAEQDGEVLITVVTSVWHNFGITNYPTFANPANFKDEGYATVHKDALPNFHTMECIGYKGTPFCQEFNGGEVNNDTLTVKSGNSGNNTYVSHVWNSPRIAGKYIYLAANVKVDNKSSITAFEDLFFIGVNDYTTSTNITPQPEAFYQEDDGSYTYIVKVFSPSSMIQCYVQIKSTGALDGDVTAVCNMRALYRDDNIIDGHIIRRLVKTGGGDYTDIRSALEDIAMSGDEVTLEVFPGVYNILDSYTSEEIASDDFIGLMVPDNCTIRGIGNKEDTIFTMYLSEGRVLPCAFNFQNSGSMENITVIAENTRYVIHDDASLSGKKYTRHVKNCTFIGRNLYYKVVYGSGCKQGADWHFENCEFINETPGTAFSNHNNTSWLLSSNITFDNCLFRTPSDVCVRLGSLNNNANGVLTYVTFRGCEFDGTGTTLWLMEENKNLYGAGILFKVSGYANEGVSLHIQNTDDKNYSGNVRLI